MPRQPKSESYEWVPISEVLLFQEGPGVRKHQYTESGVKLLNGSNISDGNLTLDNTVRFVSEDEAYGRYSHFLVDEGDLLIASSGIAVEKFDRKIAYASKEHLPLCMNTSTIRFKTKDAKRLHLDYFRRFLATSLFKNQLRRLITGSAQLNFGPSHLKQMFVPLPPLEEQKRIAAILDKADGIRRKRQQAIELADQLLRSVFIDMFGDPVTNPNGYQFKTLGRVADVRDGTHDTPKYQSEGFPLITSKNLRNGNIDFSDIGLISSEDFHQINRRSKVDFGDLLMPMIGTIGNPVFVDIESQFAIKNVALIKKKPDGLSNKYIQHLLQSHYFKWATDRDNRGGTQKFLSLGSIRAIPIPIPPDSDVLKFEQVLDMVFESRKHLLESARIVDDMFLSLSQKAFDGKITQSKAA